MDASLAIDAIVGEATRKARALRFFGICNARGVEMIVPPTFPSEADTAVRRMIARGQMPAAEMPFAFGALDMLPLDMAQGATELKAVKAARPPNRARVGSCAGLRLDLRRLSRGARLRFLDGGREVCQRREAVAPPAKRDDGADTWMRAMDRRFLNVQEV